MQRPQRADGRAAECQVNKKIQGSVRYRTVDAPFPDRLP